MEQVYPRVPHTDEPEVYLGEFGKGRVIYFPWDIDRTLLGSALDRSRQTARNAAAGPPTNPLR